MNDNVALGLIIALVVMTGFAVGVLVGMGIA